VENLSYIVLIYQKYNRELFFRNFSTIFKLKSSPWNTLTVLFSYYSVSCWKLSLGDLSEPGVSVPTKSFEGNDALDEDSGDGPSRATLKSVCPAFKSIIVLANRFLALIFSKLYEFS
jgi:hypothetical protein